MRLRPLEALVLFHGEADQRLRNREADNGNKFCPALN
jgi:hypothetical protein